MQRQAETSNQVKKGKSTRTIVGHDTAKEIKSQSTSVG